jgi:isopenicillin-N epimerase
MLDCSIDALDVDFYTGNLHKWAFAAKGAAILHVAPRWRGRIHPVTISHAYGHNWLAEFDWTGTFDPSAWLTIPDALAIHDSLPGLRAANVELAWAGAKVVADATGFAIGVPHRPDLHGSMVTMVVPERHDGDMMKLLARTGRMYETHRVEVPYMGYDHRVLLRVSAQAYNRIEDYRRLAEVLTSGG